MAWRTSRLTLSVQREGLRVSAGFDKDKESYGQKWNLEVPGVRSKFVWLILD